MSLAIEVASPCISFRHSSLRMLPNSFPLDGAFLSQSFCSVLAFKSSACDWAPYIIFTLLWFPIIETYSSKADVHVPKWGWPHFSFVTLPSGHRRWTGGEHQISAGPVKFVSSDLRIVCSRDKHMPPAWTNNIQMQGMWSSHFLLCAWEKREQFAERWEWRRLTEGSRQADHLTPPPPGRHRKSSLHPATFPIPSLHLSGSQCHFLLLDSEKYSIILYKVFFTGLLPTPERFLIKVAF